MRVMFGYGSIAPPTSGSSAAIVSPVEKPNRGGRRGSRRRTAVRSRQILGLFQEAPNSGKGLPRISILTLLPPF